MESAPEAGQSGTRITVSSLSGLTAVLAVASPTMATPVLFAEISEELGLTLVQVGAVWGPISFAGLFASLAGVPGYSGSESPLRLPDSPSQPGRASGMLSDAGMYGLMSSSGDPSSMSTPST